MSKLQKTAIALAATTMMVAPVAAQAGTRANSSPVAVDVQRAAPGTVDANDLAHFNAAWLLLLLAAIAAFVAVVSGGRSRGG